MLMNIILLIAGFLFLTYGADMFIDGASALARRFHIPEIVIGLTVVAFGTSLSEASVSIASVLHGADGVAVGNILGSNIANIFLVLGITAIITTLSIQKNTIRYEIPFVGFITLLLMCVGAYWGVISRFWSGVLVALLCIFMFYLVCCSRQEIESDTPAPHMSGIKMILFLVVGIAAVIFSSNLIVDSSVNIARAVHISERIIGLTVIAFGTSLPELVTCIVAAIKKRSDLAVGNIIGSNIINILFVLGVTGLIKPIPFEPAFLIDGAVGIIAVVMLWLFVFRCGKLTRNNGIVLLLSYFFYLGYLFM